jgi:hypothetical protein
MKKAPKPVEKPKKPGPRPPAGRDDRSKNGQPLTDDELGKVSGGVTEMGIKDHSV